MVDTEATVDELTDGDRTLIKAIVDGIQRRDRKRRRASRKGWAFLVTAGVSVPVASGALDGSISLVGAVVRIILALLVTGVAANIAGTLLDTYQSEAAATTVEQALVRAKSSVTEQKRTRAGKMEMS